MASSGPAGDTSGECVMSGLPLWWILTLVVLAVAPLVVAAYLYRAAGR
jgi:hypothetical protein